MSSQIRIYNLIVNGITQNANIDIGRNVQNSHTANLKLSGANFSMGIFHPIFFDQFRGSKSRH